MGDFFVGLDDDAHPVGQGFLQKIKRGFELNANVGIIAFQEVRGVFESDDAVRLNALRVGLYNTNDFVGCGFSIRKRVYDMTRGFPVWVDIYGEEPCLSLEVLDLGWGIIYDGSIIINHRVDALRRVAIGRKYFRFERQLVNSVNYFIVYYPNPVPSVLRLIFRALKTCLTEDKHFFPAFLRGVLKVISKLYYISGFRRPVGPGTITMRSGLRGIVYFE